VHLIVPEYLDVLQAHEQVHRFSDAMLAETGIPGEWHTHFEPCRRRYCVECPVADCPIREKAFVARRQLTISEATDVKENFPA